MKKVSSKCALVDDLEKGVGQLEHLEKEPRGSGENRAIEEVKKKRRPNLKK